MTDDLDLYGDDLDLDEHAYDDEPPRLLVDDPDWTRLAARHLRAIRRYSDVQHTTDQAFAKEINHLEDRRAEQAAKWQRKIDWHERMLTQAHEQILADDPTRKTVVLPGGELWSRSARNAAVAFTNKDEFMAWAHVNAPHLLAVTFTPNKKAIEKAIADGDLVLDHEPTPDDPAHAVAPATGEQLPGMHVAKNRTLFGVRLDGSEL